MCDAARIEDDDYRVAVLPVARTRCISSIGADGLNAHLSPQPAVERARPFRLCQSTTRAEIEVGPGGSMLAALGELGAKVDASSEGGICGACEVC